MVVDPEAVQQALRRQYPPPEVLPDASVWMREIVAAVDTIRFSIGSEMYSTTWNRQ